MRIPTFRDLDGLREGVIWAEVLNRTEDKMDLYFVDAKSGKSRIVLTESTPGAWIDFDHVEVRFLKSKGQFLWPSWRDGNMHIYLYSFDKQNPMAADAKLERQLEQGRLRSTGHSGRRRGRGNCVFRGEQRRSAADADFFGEAGWLGFQGADHRTKASTAAISATTGNTLPTCIPGRMLHRSISLCAVGGDCNPVWKAHDEINEYGLRAPKQLEFKADDGTTLYGRLLLPPEAPASGKIPLIVNIYGGPAAQMVRKDAPSAFDEILARKGFAIFAVDNRGTPGRDRKFQTAIRHEFGAIELKDQLTALDQLLAQFPQLDNDRMAIWGWSNGGSMTLYAMTHSERFRAGVAVAPVTNQVNYDSIYTERYMGLLKDDKAGYEQSDVTKSADKLHGALLLVHGTSDDNVHFQNSIQMINALINAGKPFRLMIYPNKTHSISGKDARVHLFTMIEEHFERELK